MPIPRAAWPRSTNSAFGGRVVLRCQFREQLVPPKSYDRVGWTCDANSAGLSAQPRDLPGRVVLRCHILQAARFRSIASPAGVGRSVVLHSADAVLPIDA